MRCFGLVACTGATNGARPYWEGSGGGGRAWLSGDNDNRVEEGMGVVLGALGEFHP